MFCSACGVLNAEDARFCSTCGRQIQTEGALTGDVHVYPPSQPRGEAPPSPYHQAQTAYGAVPGSPTNAPPQYASPPTHVHVTQQVQVAAPTVLVQPKSVALALVLTFFFGPLGLFYSSVTGGIVMLIASVVIGATTLGFGLWLTWPACMVWGAIAASNANSAAALAARGPTQINRY
jgi:hypothetical protein